MKPFLIIQLRPEDAAADEEYAALLAEQVTVRAKMPGAFVARYRS
ncbi:hypothetical protein [Rhodophyticola sp. CCM32]|nr:hypothetical protein [Rhodophyticola sp. CCM32]